MAQKIKVQDGIIVYETYDPTLYDVKLDIEGQLVVTKNITVGNNTDPTGTITTNTVNQNLIITTAPGGHLFLTPQGNLNLTPTGAISLNSVIWPTGPQSVTSGSYLGASNTNTLKFYSFVFAQNGSDDLTPDSNPITGLNYLYPTIQPGQCIVGPSVVYECISTGTWRILQARLGYTPVNVAGDTMLGDLVLYSGAPATDQSAATKRYVDQLASGVNLHGAVETSTTPASNLPLNSYTNGVSGGGFDPGGQGVGATIIAQNNGNLNTLGVGGYSILSNGARILVKDQLDPIQNGIYVITDLGVEDPGGVKWILTRAADYNNSAPNQVHAGAVAYVQEGTLGGTQWIQTSQGTGPLDGTVIGFNSIVFTQFSGAGTFTGGAGINISGNIVSNTGVLNNIAGSGISVSSTTGNVTIGNTGVISAIAGTGISVSSGVGNVTFGNTGVTSLIAGSGISISAATGTVTVNAISTATPPAGPVNSVQYNNSGVLGGWAGLTVGFLGQLSAQYDILINGISVGRGTGPITNNIMIGTATNISGTDNTILGVNAMSTNTSGSFNIAVGSFSLNNNTTGYNNTAIGPSALLSNGVGIGNTAIGFEAMIQNIGGSGNVAVGSSTLHSNTSGAGNTAIGSYALNQNDGVDNTAIGSGAMSATSGINGCTAIGVNALQNNQSQELVAVGLQALMLNTTGGANTAIGVRSLLNNTTGSVNTTLGSDTLSANINGTNNTALGYASLTSNISGGQNTAIGVRSGFVVTGSGNVIVGYESLYNNTSGSNNIAIGTSALFNSTGSGNIVLGSGYSLTSGDNNVIIGGNDGSSIDTLSNHVIISDGAGNIRATSSDIGVFDITGSLTVNGVPIGFGSGSVTSVGGTGTVSGLTLSGLVTTTGDLTLGGTLSLTSLDVTTALTYIPYNATNPAGYITSAGTATNVSGIVAIANGGTGQTTANSAFNALAPAQSAGKFLTTDGSNTSWSTTLVTTNGSVAAGTGSLATNATNGFFYIPTCAGVPTGVPTAISGFAPMVIDSTDNRLYVYVGGSWLAINVAVYS